MSRKEWWLKRLDSIPRNTKLEWGDKKRTEVSELNTVGQFVDWINGQPDDIVVIDEYYDDNRKLDVTFAENVCIIEVY